MFWFVIGCATGVFFYNKLISIRTPVESLNVLYLEEQIAAHEYMLNYYKQIRNKLK